MNSQFENTQSISIRPRFRVKRWLLILAALVLAFVFLAVLKIALRAVWSMREDSGRRQMSVELEVLSGEGIPIDNHQIDLLYQSQTSAEFSKEWEQLLAALKTESFVSSWKGVPAFDSSIASDEVMDITENWPYAENCLRFTEENRDLIRSARKLASVPDPIRFPIVFQSTETLIPDVVEARNVARLLWTDAQVGIYLKNKDRVATDIAALFEITKHVDAVPILVSRLTGIAIRSQGFDALQGAIRVDLLDDAQLLQLNDLLGARKEIGKRWAHIITDELSSMLPVFISPNIAMDLDVDAPARGHDAVYFIGLMNRAIDLETDDWTTLYSGAQQLETKLEEDIDTITKSVDRILSSLLAPAFEALAAALIHDAQLHRQASIAIHLRLHEHATGGLPRTLDELPREVATLRPYGSRPFGYLRDDASAVLWGFRLSKEVLQTPESFADVSDSTKLDMVWRLQSKSNSEESDREEGR